jgi:hypothetical protein
MRTSPVGRLGRITAALLLSAAQLVLAAASHHHSSNLIENLTQEDSGQARELHEIVCRTPHALHWHADKTIEVEPCLACLRHHLVGVEVAPPARIVVPAVRLRDPEIPRSAVAGFILQASSRGPPAAV